MSCTSIYLHTERSTYQRLLKLPQSSSASDGTSLPSHVVPLFGSPRACRDTPPCGSPNSSLFGCNDHKRTGGRGVEWGPRPRRSMLYKDEMMYNRLFPLERWWTDVLLVAASTTSSHRPLLPLLDRGGADIASREVALNAEHVRVFLQDLVTHVQGGEYVYTQVPYSVEVRSFST